MSAAQQAEAAENELRRYVYDHFMKSGVAPAVKEMRAALSWPYEEVRATLGRLADKHVLVLQWESGEVLMAPPFSAVPTAFLVEVGDRRYWGNCIWDALGIPVMLREDARIVTSCADCSEAITLTVETGALRETEGIIHFAVPARGWWDDVVFT